MKQELQDYVAWLDLDPEPQLDKKKLEACRGTFVKKQWNPSSGTLPAVSGGGNQAAPSNALTSNSNNNTNSASGSVSSQEYKEVVYSTTAPMHFEPIGPQPKQDYPWVDAPLTDEWILVRFNLPEDYSSEGSVMSVSINTTMYFADFLMEQGSEVLDPQQEMLQQGMVVPFILEDTTPRVSGMSM